MPPVLGLTVALPEADQAVRRIKDDDDQHDTEDELPGVRQMGGGIEPHAFEHRSTRERAESMGAAAEDCDEHKLTRLGPEAELGRRDLLNDRYQRAANPPRNAEIT